MKNAHLRIGTMNFSKPVGKTPTRFHLHLDRFIGERTSTSIHKAHFLSVFGGDAQIAAASAIIAAQESFEVGGPGLEALNLEMGPKAECYRASIQLAGKKRPLRHLIAVSEEFGSQINSNTSGRTLLADSRPEYVWASVAQIFGLPGVPQWAAWFYDKLFDNMALTPLYGLGCRPVLISGSKQEFLGWLSAGIRKQEIQFPEANGPAVWPSSHLKDILLPPEVEPVDRTRVQ